MVPTEREHEDKIDGTNLGDHGEAVLFFRIPVAGHLLLMAAGQSLGDDRQARMAVLPAALWAGVADGAGAGAGGHALVLLVTPVGQVADLGTDVAARHPTLAEVQTAAFRWEFHGFVSLQRQRFQSNH